MSRPTKQGLEYYPLDCQFDDKTELLIAEVGSDAVSVLVTAWQLIYQNNGYYIENGKDLYLLIKRRIMIDLDVIENVINLAIERNIFDKSLENKYQVLTSKAIQKRYFLASSRRKTINVVNEYVLTEVNVYKNISLTDVNGVNVNKNPIKESKVKESKVNKNKEEEPSNSEKSELPEIPIIKLIPDDYEPEQMFIDRMRASGITQTIIEQQIEPFIAHQQMKKTTSDNWDANFKSWLVNGKVNGWHKSRDENNGSNKHNNNSGKKPSAGDKARAAIEREIEKSNSDLH